MTSARFDGIELIIEPDVRPKGTIDLKNLDAAPGTFPPAMRVSSTGRVVPRESPSGFMAPIEAPPPPPTAPEPRATGRRRPEPEPERSISAEALLEAAEAAAGDTRTLAALDEAARAPMPVRPAAAAIGPSALVSSPRQDRPDVDPDELGEGFSAVWTLLKVLVYLLTLTALLGALGWWLVGPSLSQPTLATAPGVPVTAPPTPPTSEDPKPPEQLQPLEKTDPEVSPPIETPPTPARDPEEVGLEALRLVAKDAKTGGEVDVEEDAPGLMAKLESLRAQALEAWNRKPKDLKAARAALEELLAAKPDDGDATFRLGLIDHTEGKMVDAEARYRAASGLSPNDPRPYNNLGLVLLARGGRDEAEDAYIRGLTSEGNENDPNLNVNYGRLLETKGSADLALQAYDRALKTDPAHGPGRLARANLRRSLKQPEAAREDLDALAKSGSPLVPPALDGLGILAREAARVEEAVGLHRRALELDPAYTAARVNLGLALLDQGKADDAAAELVKATKAAPKDARAWSALGVARTRQAEKNPEILHEAREAYEAALKLDGKDTLTLFNYALCAERFGNFLYAMAKYEEILKLDPKAWRAWGNLARLYQRGNNAAKALAIVERGLQALPDSAELHYHRATILVTEKREQDARASLRRFVELARPDDPRLPEVKRGLEGS